MLPLDAASLVKAMHSNRNLIRLILTVASDAKEAKVANQTLNSFVSLILVRYLRTYQVDEELLRLLLAHLSDWLRIKTSMHSDLQVSKGSSVS